MKKMYKGIKRLLDILVSILFFPIFLLLYIIIGIVIKIEDRGPVFYVSDRLGKDAKTYKMYKFRTMKVNAEDIRNADGSTFNGDDDPRVTKVGKILRKTSIDEIPQIMNVLFGNMSIVGPRPDLPEHYNLYSENEKKKLQVLPGITGYNQAYYRNSIEWKKRLENDVYYVEHISFMLDIKIVFKTIASVLKKENVYIDASLEKENKKDESNKY